MNTLIKTLREKLTNKELFFALCLILIIFWGTFLRLYHLGEQSYWIDEGFSLNAVTATLEKGLPLLDSGFYYLRSILNTYVIASFVKSFGFTPFVARLSTALFGAALLPLIFFFVKRLTSEKSLALIATTFTALSYWEIAWSRQARMYIQFQFFFFAALFAFWLCLEKFTKKRFVATVLLTLAAILSHEFGFLLLSVYLLSYIIYFYTPLAPNPKTQITQKNAFLKFIDRFFWFIFPALALVVPFFGLKLYQLFLARFFVEDFNVQTDFIAGSFIIFFSRIFDWLIFLALAGIIIYVIRNKKIFPAIFLFISFIIPFYLIIVSTDLLHLRYLVFLYPLLYTFMGMFILEISKLMTYKFKFRQLISTILLVVFTAGLVIAIPHFIYKPETFYSLEFGSPQADFSGAYYAVKKLGWDEKSQIISPYPAMDKIYLGRSTYWLPLSLSGKSEETLNVPASIYTGAPRIDDFSTLDKNKTTYLVLDAMAINRLGDTLAQTIKDNFYEVYEAQNIIVFQYKK